MYVHMLSTSPQQAPRLPVSAHLPHQCQTSLPQTARQVPASKFLLSQIWVTWAGLIGALDLV